MDARAASPNDRERYENFRRAIATRDSQSWADIAVWCRPLMIAWARQKLARIPIVERCDDIADEAFARAWFALASTSHDAFPNLAAMLGYLRTCVASVIIDRVRAQSDNKHVPMWMEFASQPSPEQLVLKELHRREIWSCINQHVATEQERIVVYESVILSLPPRIILQRHPNLFEDAAAIYRIKRNLFERLRRDDNLRQLCAE